MKRNWDWKIRRMHSSRPLQGTMVPVQASEAKSPEERARELRILLQQLGSYYGNFALYLSSRIDLLPAEYCRELALVPDIAPALPEKEIAQLLLQALGPRGLDSFVEFDYRQPITSLTTQSHIAKLRTGSSVIVTLLRPEYHSLPDIQRQNPFFYPNSMISRYRELLTDNLAGDFWVSLKRKTDLAAQASAMELGFRSAKASEILDTRFALTELCTSKVLTVEYKHSVSLGEFLEKHPHSKESIAVHLCHAWIHLALTGSVIPVDLQLSHVFLHEDKFHFFGCDFAQIPKRTQDLLRNYFTAAATDNPDYACAHLLREMSRTSRSELDIEKFRSDFRQAAQFGILEPILGTNSNSLPQLIFQHWKTALDHGYQPNSDLLLFYRGLFAVCRIAYALSPIRDSLREGLDEFLTVRTLNEVWGLGDWRSWSQSLDKYATALANLPSVLDQSLTSAATAPEEGSQLMPRTEYSERQSQESSAVSTALIILAATIVLSQISHMQAWTAKLAVVAMMLAGILLFQRLGR